MGGSLHGKAVPVHKKPVHSHLALIGIFLSKSNSHFLVKQYCLKRRSWDCRLCAIESGHWISILIAKYENMDVSNISGVRQSSIQKVFTYTLEITLTYKIWHVILHIVLKVLEMQIDGPFIFGTPYSTPCRFPSPLTLITGYKDYLIQI